MLAIVMLAPLVLAVLLWLLQQTFAPAGFWRIVLRVLMWLSLAGFVLLLYPFILWLVN